MYLPARLISIWFWQGSRGSCYAAATRRAERAQSLLPDEEGNDVRGPEADQALNWPVILPARGIVGPTVSGAVTHRALPQAWSLFP